MIDDAVWGFSHDVLRNHIASASFGERLRSSIDLVFIRSQNGEGTNLWSLGSWQPLLTHFVFLINVDLAGCLEVTKHRVVYRLPLFNKGGRQHTLEIFIHEDSDRLSGCRSGGVRWDMVCRICQASASGSKQRHQDFSSVLYAASWSGSAIVNSCAVSQDENNPIVAFICLAYVFLAVGEPDLSDGGSHC